jgi:hypothetical protein
MSILLVGALFGGLLLALDLLTAPKAGAHPANTALKERRAL